MNLKAIWKYRWRWQKEAEKVKREHILEAKQEIQQLRQEFDSDIRERRSVIVSLEQKLTERELALNNRFEYLNRREETLNHKDDKLEQRKEQVEAQYSKVEELVAEQESKLIEIANLSQEDAKNIIMKRVEDDMANEIAIFVRDEEDKAKNLAQTKSKELMALAMQKYAAETTSERAVTVVNIPRGYERSNYWKRRPTLEL